MAHIDLPQGLPGIVGPLAFRPETARPLGELAQVLLRGPSSLTPVERELIATHVSALNECHFCASSHRAAAIHLDGGSRELAEAVRLDYHSAPISEKLKALLTIAGKVQRDGRTVASEDIEAARNHGATDVEIHDTVLIAAAFCMFNRYVDGLATWAPEPAEAYDEMGQRLATVGYNAG